MPSTKHRLNDSVRQALPSRREEEIELARVYLELNTRVRPTWGPAVEPDAYITDLEGEIVVSREGVDDRIHVGTVSAHSVHLGEADEDGVPWFDVLDARDGDTAMYTDLINVDGSCYSEWVESNLDPFGNDLLILDRIRIKPEYRGNGYGLYAAQLMITGFASSGVVACVPAPYELLENAPLRDPVPARRVAAGRFRVGRLQKPSYAAWVAAWIRASSKFRRVRFVAEHSPSVDGDRDAQVPGGQAEKEIECSGLSLTNLSHVGTDCSPRPAH